MNVLEKISSIWRDIHDPFLIYDNVQYTFEGIIRANKTDISCIRQGDVVALIGDFTPQSIYILLKLIEIGAIIVPLTKETIADYEYFFDAAQVDVLIRENTVTRRPHKKNNPLITELRNKNHAGLVLFSTGTTGRPKAILHDVSLFLRRYETQRPALRTLNFLLFDHIGGINTLFHTLLNKGVIIAPAYRTMEYILNLCHQYHVEVLPTTPTFLRMLLMSGAVPNKIPSGIKIITYGTERMDQPTLDALCTLLPTVDFRQTYGMSELGILRIKSESRKSLFMKIGGEGILTKVVDNVLYIKSQTKMLGYLNAPSPFDANGWYNTHDIVEEKNGFYKVTGRIGDAINVGGVKFMASDVEHVALEYPGITLVKAYARPNPITGYHVEIEVSPQENAILNKDLFFEFLKTKLQSHMVPRKIIIKPATIGHRFKRL